MARLAACVARVRRQPPQIPWLSNLSGALITAEQAQSPDYWARHLRETVRFSENLELLFRNPERVLLEIWPGEVLTKLIKRHPACPEKQLVLSTLSSRSDQRGGDRTVLHALSRLWLSGVEIDWARLHHEKPRRRVPLPTYPFERKRFFLDCPAERALSAAPSPPMTDGQEAKAAAADEWFYQPAWRSSSGPPWRPDPSQVWLIFADQTGWGGAAARALTATGHRVIEVYEGPEFQSSEASYVLPPGGAGGYERLLRELRERRLWPRRVLHLWNLNAVEPELSALSALPVWLERSFYSLLGFAQALGSTADVTPMSLGIVTSGLHAIDDEPTTHPAQAAALGPCRVIPQEYEHLRCQNIDLPAVLSAPWDELVTRLLAECGSNDKDQVVAYRRGQRLIRTFEPVRLPPAEAATTRLRPRGVYMITGGLGGIGLELATYLAQAVQARLILVGRSPASTEIQARLKALEMLGAEVLVEAASVADQERMQAVLTRTLQRFGRLDGVIHAAGIGSGRAIQNSSPEQAALVLAPKVWGTMVLDEVTKGCDLDFMLLCSSVNALTGGFGQADYSAANAFLDAFAQHKKGPGRTRVQSVNWDTWGEVGIAARAAAGAPPWTAPPVRPRRASGYPLLGERRQENGGAEFSARIAPAQSWLLEEHRLFGQPTLPGTAYLELALAALSDLEPRSPGRAELKDVVLLSLLSIPDGKETTVRTVLRKSPHGFDFEVRSESPSGAPREHARGHIAVAEAPDPPPPPISIAELLSGAQEVPPPSHFSVESPVQFGPRWGGLQRLWLKPGEAIGRLVLQPEFLTDLKQHPLHPALLDCAVSLLPLPGFYLPFAYENVRTFGPLPPDLYSFVRPVQLDESSLDTVRLAVTLFDGAGNLLMDMNGYVLRRYHDQV